MHGLFFEIFEAWVIEYHDLSTWHTIKEVADCHVKDKSFVSRGSYPYSMILDLIVATSEIVEIRQDRVLHLFGRFLVGYLFGAEYGSLLRCQGSTLREWLSHLNEMHNHFQKSFHSEKFCPPVFWCEDSEEDERCILLHYFSHRGNIFIPMVNGIVEELAKSHFEVDVRMDLLGKQDENDWKYTSWKISAYDESLTYKLKPPKAVAENQKSIPESFKNFKIPMTCPISGNQARVHRLSRQQSVPALMTEGRRMNSSQKLMPGTGSSAEGISMDLMRDVFPFHVIVDKEFRILQVGRVLPKVLQATEEDLQGIHIQEVFTITRPVFAFSWDWQSLNRLSHQSFFLAETESFMMDKQIKNIIDFKAGMLALSNDKVLFSLCPHVKNLQQLNEMGLSLSDLSLVTSQRDAVFLGEYVSEETRKTHSLDKLSKKLQSEQKLSNTLLYNMLPRQVADDLRVGQTIEPRHYDNVTLFFSDIVGFTSLCQKVEPWEVIDLMNQLYSVMDALADRFHLYKVETVGDSYMCASGIPIADSSHGENIANFALAVLECTKHVKSPVTRDPIELRIGIHTGSCTAGVVGSLAPRYALFGDMVNVASRHESTGMPGRIQCSRELFDLLQRGDASTHFEFQERGFVDMKGKGEHLTYWLNCGTDANSLANPKALERLSQDMKNVLISQKWKMQKYFDKDDTTHHDLEDSLIPVPPTRSNSVISQGTNKDSTMTTATVVVDMSEWYSILLDSSVKREELQDKIFDVLYSTLERCVGKGGDTLEAARKDLLHFVDLICGLYTHENVFQNVTNVLLRAEFLLRLRKRSNGYDPWDDFVLLFSAFIRDVDLDAEENSQLASRNGASSVGEGMSMEAAIEFLEDDYEDLCEVIFRGCPRFRKVMRKLAVASAEIESEANFRAMLMEFDRVMADTNTNKRALRRKNEVQLGMILILSTCGHYCQSYEVFLHWNQLQFKAELQAHKDGVSEDPREEWHEWQAAVFKASIYHLLDRTDRFLTDGMSLRKQSKMNEGRWKREGKEWVGAVLVPYAKVDATLDESYSYEQHINRCIQILERYLRRVVASHKRHEDGDGGDDASEASDVMEAKTPYEELQLTIEMSPDAGRKQIKELPRVVKQELRAFVMTIAGGYNENEFHSFRHASHVVLLSNLLMESIDLGAQGTDCVTSDPLVCFAIVLSALVHDVGHTGVPNGQVAEENPELADRYNNKSIAEQNSIDVAWEALMSKSLKHLQMCLFGSSESEKKRLRQLLVNNVMATDIFDKDLRVLRQKRWERAATCDHTKKTLAMEHIMQTSDVAHTMQEWDIYREWNERLFLEMYEAFSEGRADVDPIDGWYNGEIWFFDNWVIPLAQNLKTCGVLSIVSDELVERARNNKRRWAVEGEKICRLLWQKARERQFPVSNNNIQRSSSKSSILARRSSMHSEESTAVETMLAATIVEEIESLSKVMERYEEKIAVACTNLIGITYKDENSKPAQKLKAQSWRTVRKFFRKQRWYRTLHDGSFRDEDDDDEVIPAQPPATPEEKKEDQEGERIDVITEADDDSDGGDDDDMSCLTDASDDPMMHARHAVSHTTLVGDVR